MKTKSMTELADGIGTTEGACFIFKLVGIAFAILIASIVLIVKFTTSIWPALILIGCDLLLMLAAFFIAIFMCLYGIDKEHEAEKENILSIFNNFIDKHEKEGNPDAN